VWVQISQINYSSVSFAYSEVHTGKYFSANLHVQNGTQEGDDLLPVLINIVLDYAITPEELSRTEAE
jgi:hypothetical protein